MSVLLAHFDYRKTPESDQGTQVFKHDGKCYAIQGGSRSVDLHQVSKGEYEQLLAKGWKQRKAGSWGAYFAAMEEYRAQCNRPVKKEPVECQLCLRLGWSDEIVHGMCGRCQEEAVTSG